MKKEKWRNQFESLVRECLELQQLEDDAYWAAREVFQGNLKLALDDDKFLMALNKRCFVMFLAWCSNYRPACPVSILTKVSQLVEKDAWTEED